jgi:hypothetical protein
MLGETSVSNPLTMKLEHGARLTDEDRALLHDLTSRTRQIPAH